MLTEDRIIGELVAEDYRTAQIFKNHKIDFCCQGNRSIAAVCETENLDKTALMDEIKSVQNQTSTNTIDYQSWPLDLLADYIEKKHHRYAEKQIPIIREYLAKICQVHGSHHPELFEISKNFTVSSGELAMHMKKEELILFPLMRKMVKEQENGGKIDPTSFGSVSVPIQKMMSEHETEGERFREIAKLSNDYTPPADACNTYRVAFGLLKEYEADLHLHIHLENNILFPNSIALEKELSA